MDHKKNLRVLVQVSQVEIYLSIILRRDTSMRSTRDSSKKRQNEIAQHNRSKVQVDRQENSRDKWYQTRDKCCQIKVEDLHQLVTINEDLECRI